MRCGENRYLSIFKTFLHAQLFNLLVDIDQNVLKQVCQVSLFTLILCVQLLRALPKFRNPFFKPKIRITQKIFETFPQAESQELLKPNRAQTDITIYYLLYKVDLLLFLTKFFDKYHVCGQILCQYSPFPEQQIKLSGSQ